MYRLTDGRDRSFKIETENLKEILYYLDYNQELTFEEAQEQLEEENDGMDFYHLAEI